MTMSSLALSGNKTEAFQAIIPGAGRNHFKNFTNASSYTATLEAATSLISLFSTQDCWCRLVRSDASDVAAVPAEGVKQDCFFVPGGIVAFMGIPVIEGVRYKVAVIRDSTSGVLHISEGA